MDEITIGDKVYVSSKQAAKITGYAKDYVGQLCREGRVDARLVGRNWYVLEDSIREHRFGKAPEEVEEVSSPSVSESRVATWQVPQYEAEVASRVPDLMPKSAANETTPAIADMQSAWKEWFEDKKPGAAVVPTPDTAKEPETSLYREEESVEEVSVVLTRVETSREVAEAVPAEAEEEVELHRSYASRDTGERVPATNVPIVDLSPTTRLMGEKKRVAEEKAAAGNGAFRAALIVLAVGAILLAVVATGNAEKLVGGYQDGYGPQKSILDFLAGKSTYEGSL